MTHYTPPHPDCPPAYGGCTCSCHRMPGVMHCVPCCRPSPGEPEVWPVGDEECIEPTVYDDKAAVPLTAGQSTAPHVGTYGWFPGDIAPAAPCTCKPDDMPPDVVSPDCPKHDPKPTFPGTSASYVPLPECCGESPRHCDCLGNDPAEPCWGKVEQNAEDFGEGAVPFHECQGHYDRVSAYYKYKPEPSTPPRT